MYRPALPGTKRVAQLVESIIFKIVIGSPLARLGSPGWRYWEKIRLVVGSSGGPVNVNLRAGPGVDYVITGSLAVGARAAVINSDTDASGAEWWQLEDGNWVRSDLVTSEDTCEADFRDTPQDWVDQARNRIAVGAYLLEGIADGSWHEGMAYQSYMLTMTLPFLVNLSLIEDADIFPHSYLRSYTSWHI
jgi:hypothetical protein